MAKAFDIYPLLRPLFFALDPETAHKIAIRALKYGMAPKAAVLDTPILNTELFGLHFPNPVGLAAGFDKQAEAIQGVLNMGFGFVELGTVTPQPQSGNPRPRMFRIPTQKAVINRFGFNSEGHEVVRKRLAAFVENNQGKPHAPIGLNVGSNKNSLDIPADYVRGIRTFAPYADYLTVNISSPNTPGLRDMQRRAPLLDLLKQVMDARTACTRQPPLLVKIAPDLTDDQAKDIAEVVREAKVDGVIVSNTTISRPDYLPANVAKEAGGLSGAPLRDMSTQFLGTMYKLTEGKIPLIGSGGIFTGNDAYAKIRAGASLVQIYTSMVYRGPLAAVMVAEELAALLQRDGFANIADAVGIDHK